MLKETKVRIRDKHTDKKYNVYKSKTGKNYWVTVRKYPERFAFRYSRTFEEAIKLTETL